MHIICAWCFILPWDFIVQELPVGLMMYVQSGSGAEIEHLHEDILLLFFFFQQILHVLNLAWRIGILYAVLGIR